MINKDTRETTHLVVRKDGVLCCVCYTLLPIHPGDGTPLGTFMVALENAVLEHPAKSHGTGEAAW